MRSRCSPLATAIRKGLVFDQLGAVMASAISSSISSLLTGVGRKLLVLLLDARNALNSLPLIAMN
jgi:hypothetical protein